MRDYNCPELVREWKRLVNDNTEFMRDAALLKKFLAERGASPAQVLLGMYQYKESRTITIPQFLRSWEVWLVEDEWEAEVELAVNIAHSTPPAYVVWQDLRYDVFGADDYNTYKEACVELTTWKDRVLG